MNLEWLYRGSAVLAALCIVSIALLILAQIIGRMFGFIIPSADDFAGYCMAASIFLALPYTLRSGDHIRVTMILHRLPVAGRYWIEVFCVTVGTLTTGYFAWYTIKMVWESYQFSEISQGYVPVQLWIPQMPLAFGLVVLFIAFLEEFWQAIRRQPTHHQRESVGNE
jgi:TRAP-type C4-dicarboxylate transport system permease small subunit